MNNEIDRIMLCDELGFEDEEITSYISDISVPNNDDYCAFDDYFKKDWDMMLLK